MGTSTVRLTLRVGQRWNLGVLALPTSVWRLECGVLLNSLGTGFVLPFGFIYFHDVRGLSLGISGLIVATFSAGPVVISPLGGALIDRFSARALMIGSLAALALAFATFPFVQTAWQGFAAAALAGAGQGGLLPSQSSLLGALTPEGKRHITFSLQRTMANLGIGVGGLVGGLIASTSSPPSFDVLFWMDAATFALFLVVVLLLVPNPHSVTPGAKSRPAGRYRAVVSDRPFLGVLLTHLVLCAAGFAMFQTVVPIYARNFASVSESAIGVFFLINTTLIVLLQLPIARAIEGRRRMAGLRLVSVLWALGLVIVVVAGDALSGAAAAAVMVPGIVLWSVGECFQGAIVNPLTVDLAPPHLLGRYLALTTVAWQTGFAVAPALTGFAFRISPTATWLVAAALCLVAGAGASLLEPRLPIATRVTPLMMPPAPAVTGPIELAPGLGAPAGPTPVKPTADPAA